MNLATCEEDLHLNELLTGLHTDTLAYFSKAATILSGAEIEVSESPFLPVEPRKNRDAYWSHLPAETQGEARRLGVRLVALMGQISKQIRTAPLASEADLLDVALATKEMRAALFLRRFR